MDYGSHENSLTALANPDSDVGYHKDIAPAEFLCPDARSLVKASMSAWVFGGMGSWNDMGFQGRTQAEYEKVSKSLFEVLTKAIEAAASSTVPGQQNDC